MKIFGVVLAVLMFLAGCGDRNKHEAGTDTTSAHTPGPTGGVNAMNGGMMMSGDMEKDMSMMNDMMVTNLGQQDAGYDHRFIDMMIPHHKGAIMMAKDALEHANKPELKMMARDVVTSQQKEIDQMTEWRAKWYGENTPNGIPSSEEKMKQMSMMNDMMVKQLGQKDPDYEDRFIDMMIPHHETAIRMADDALGKATHPEIKKMAQDVIDAQKKEIARMGQWRKEWYGH